MLGIRTYTREYIESCRSRVEADVAAYRQLVASTQAAGTNAPPDAIEAFEAAFFNNMVLVLDYLFVHRLRTVEGKDGNAMNEVRILCNSLQNNNGVMTTDNVGEMVAFAGLNAIKLSPEKSVLKYEFGDEIKLTEADFVRLCSAFFAEIENRFTDKVMSA